MDLDEQLALLARASTPLGLDTMEGDVFRRIAMNAREQRRGGLGIAAAAIVAVVMGTGSTMLAAPRETPPAMSPLMPMALAPSSLLASE